MSEKKKGFDKDLEMLKLQIIAGAVESDAQRSLSTTDTFMISVSVLLFGLMISQSHVLPFGFILVLFAVVFVVWGYGTIRTVLVYNLEMRQVDVYFEDIRDEVALPSLDKRSRIRKIRFYHRIVARITGLWAVAESLADVGADRKSDM